MNLQINQVQNFFEVNQFDQDSPILKHSSEIKGLSIKIHGMWLEGADWDKSEQLLTDINKLDLYIHFPTIKIVTKKCKEKDMTLESSDISLNENENKLSTYHCPVFKTTMRLANNVYSVENEPVIFVPL